MADFPPLKHIQNGIILMKITGSLSMIGSSLVLRDLYRRYQQNKSLPLTVSILCELAFADLMSSFMCVMGTWMVPKESGAYLAAGNKASCTAQGFLANMFFGTSCSSNASLALTYYLIVKCQWKDNVSQNRKSAILIGFPPIFTFTLATLAFVYDAYNFNGMDFCDVSPYPPNCKSSSENTCTRGEMAPIFIFSGAVYVFISNVIIVASMFMLFQYVFTQQRRMSQYATSGSQYSWDLTTKTAWQGLCYIAAFAAAFWPLYVRIAIETITGTRPVVFVYINPLAMPCQGVWNALVYFRPRYKEDREKNSRDSRLNSMGRVLHLSYLQSTIKNEGRVISIEAVSVNNSDPEI